MNIDFNKIWYKVPFTSYIVPIAIVWAYIIAAYFMGTGTWIGWHVGVLGTTMAVFGFSLHLCISFEDAKSESFYFKSGVFFEGEEDKQAIMKAAQILCEFEDSVVQNPWRVYHCRFDSVKEAVATMIDSLDIIEK